MPNEAQEFLQEDSEQPETEVSENSEEQTTEASPAEQPDSGSLDDDSPQQPEDWWDTKGLDDHASKRIKSIRAEYTKKSQRLRELESEVDGAKRQYQSTVQSIQQALLSPNYLQEIESARNRLLGIQGTPTPQTQAPQMPKEGFKSTEEFLRWMDQRDNYRDQQLEQKYQQRLQQELNRIAGPIYRDRWMTADAELKKNPTYGTIYEKYSAKVMQEISNGPYASLYNEGKSEKEVLETAFFALARNDILGSVKQNTLQSFQKKREATTERPKSHKKTESKNKSTEDFVRELQELGLGFHKQ